MSWGGIAQSLQRLATGWKVQGSNLGGGEIFRICPDRTWGPPNLLYNGQRVSLPGVKRPVRGVDHPTPSRAEIIERVHIYLYSCCVVVACSRDTFTFHTLMSLTFSPKHTTISRIKSQDALSKFWQNSRRDAVKCGKPAHLLSVWGTKAANVDDKTLQQVCQVNPLTSELNPSAQCCLQRFSLGILMFKGLTVRGLYKSFGVKGLKNIPLPWRCLFYGRHGWKNHNQLKINALTQKKKKPVHTGKELEAH
jgi:hypothetical protein